MRPINHNSPIPYYHQLADILREQIEAGRWDADELIPAEGSLTETFGISRSVTRKALDVLEGEGRVLRIKGKGTIVTKPKFSYGAVEAAGGWFSPRSRPVNLGQIISTGRVPAGGNLAKLLDVSPRDELWEIILTHELDGTPASMSQIYLKVQGTLTVGGPLDFEEGGPDILHQLSAKYGVEITDSRLEIDVTAASDLDVRYLHVEEGAPIIQVSSIDSDKMGRIAGFTRTVVKAAHFFFAVDMHRGHEVSQRRPLSELVTQSRI